MMKLPPEMIFSSNEYIRENNYVGVTFKYLILNTLFIETNLLRTVQMLGKLATRVKKNKKKHFERQHALNNMVIDSASTFLFLQN